MGYVIAAILVLLVVAAGVTFFVLRATRTGRSPASIVAPDDRTPLGDTDQLSGEQGTEGRRKVSGGEAEGSGPVEPESERLANRPR